MLVRRKGVGKHQELLGASTDLRVNVIPLPGVINQRAAQHLEY